jgi:Surface antigen variable number repeat
MIPPEFADERLLRTNPVWWVDRLNEWWNRRDGDWLARPRWLVRLLIALAEQGVRIPSAAVKRWSAENGIPIDALPRTPEPKPGVVGLVVDLEDPSVSLVVPLDAEQSTEWAADPTLPFHYPTTVLQDLFVRLLAVGLDFPHLRAVPERFAFILRDQLGRPSNGPSMHVAGLLAVIREANCQPPALDRTCAVVQPEDDRLVPVRNIERKLNAFLRECGSGTLLVRGRGCTEAARYDDHFDEVWEVDSLAELAREIEKRQWLAVFLTAEKLNGAEAGRVLGRVRRLQDIDYHHAEALDLCDRAERCGFALDVPNRLRREHEHAVIDLTRLLGSSHRSAELANAVRQRPRTPRVSSHEDRALADLNFAAALFGLHRFREIHDLLDPWRERLTTDPLLVTPLTRVKVFNTLGRALVAADKDGWEELFCDSAEVMTELEPSDVPRTWCYLAHGYLRTGRLSEAEEALQRIAVHDGLDPLTRRFFCFHRASAARCRSQQWTNLDMEQAGTSRELAHPFGYYWQATARQHGRDTADALNRFSRAREFLTQDIPPEDEHNIRQFLIDCIRLAEAAWASDQQLWNESVAALGRHLTPRPGFSLNDYYAGYITEKGSQQVLLVLKRTHGPEVFPAILADETRTRTFPMIIEKETAPPIKPAPYKERTAKVGRIIIVGNTKTDDSVILKKIALSPGDVLDPGSADSQEEFGDTQCDNHHRGGQRQCGLQEYCCDVQGEVISSEGQCEDGFTAFIWSAAGRNIKATTFLPGGVAVLLCERPSRPVPIQLMSRMAFLTPPPWSHVSARGLTANPVPMIFGQVAEPFAKGVAVPVTEAGVALPIRHEAALEEITKQDLDDGGKTAHPAPFWERWEKSGNSLCGADLSANNVESVDSRAQAGSWAPGIKVQGVEHVAIFGKMIDVD